ncbi:hypothetical protein EC973_008007 [Apophysomyces ossiformis]|uniref:Uncharacterized protein n=1 Tax=Apophysomyces ossiformis TaxID=679940 RepID=A0A8H7EQ44_9FUNG|nr:hypothetical protein EC973_008007 [Apophysomyces ossiformis]
MEENVDSLEVLVDQSAHELSQRLQLNQTTSSSLCAWDNSVSQCMKRMEDLATKAVESHNQTEALQSMLKSLRDKEEELQQTFAKIDKLEAIVGVVNDTYTKVCQSVEEMEKTVYNSRSQKSFIRLKARSSSTPDIIQPYFPPPQSVDIYKTRDLFPKITD